MAKAHEKGEEIIWKRQYDKKYAEIPCSKISSLDWSPDSQSLGFLDFHLSEYLTA
tara:strand:- start:1354 stop:1518 length:165 start_codon:yes stop_codon:yes gene_type:complete